MYIHIHICHTIDLFLLFSGVNVYMCVCVLLHMHMCIAHGNRGDQRITLRNWLWPSTLLRWSLLVSLLLSNAFQVSWPVSFWLSCLYFFPHGRGAGLFAVLLFSHGFWKLNSGCLACRTSTFPAEAIFSAPHNQPLLNFQFCRMNRFWRLHMALWLQAIIFIIDLTFS